ncbi:mitochondrial 50S ribosomal protein L3 [Artomyces pyxidatus]|uniref:Mitochondrial 50S ribosomal protein L3 n=1 Tax=Artomyces pyxidatus TaxID=48021 RepID=A0ACB8T8J0_9AGAM|nr:mitochondrial 50S ribosomal protein L3 [Artomyces pyxidatus]
MLRLWALAERPAFPSCRQIHSSVVANATATTSAVKWTPDSIRTGVIARKRGMTAMWDDQGVRFPVTVLQLEECQVTANVTTVRKDQSEYHAVQVAASDRPAKTATKQMLGHFRKAGVAPKRIVKEFPITPDAHVPVGTTLSAVHFVPGQFVDVIANSIGKGFQGTMKRWNFKGLRASHGVSVSHRSAGSTGAHQDPGRIWPGKKMAGRMGGTRITAQNLAVVRVDSALDLIFVRGCVPGVDDAHVMVRDAKKKMVSLSRAHQAKGEYEKVLPKGVNDLPFPAGTQELAKALPPVIVAPSLRRSPFIPRE